LHESPQLNRLPDGQEQRKRSLSTALADIGETGIAVEVSKGIAGQMLHRPLQHNHQHVIKKPPPPAIAIPIENQQAASRPEDAVHLRHHARLRRIVMKAVRASDQIESVILERQALAITLDEMEASPGALAPGLTLAKHAVAEVDAPDLCIG